MPAEVPDDLLASIVTNWQREDPVGWTILEEHIVPNIGTLVTERLPPLREILSPSEQIAWAAVECYRPIAGWESFDKSTLHDIATNPTGPWPWQPGEIPGVVARTALRCVIPAATATPPRIKLSVRRERDDQPYLLLPSSLGDAAMLTAVRLRLVGSIERELVAVELLDLPPVTDAEIEAEFHAKTLADRKVPARDWLWDNRKTLFPWRNIPGPKPRERCRDIHEKLYGLHTRGPR